MSTSLIAYGDLSPGSDLNAYIKTVGAIPILTAEEEKELAHRFYDEGDVEAARELVISHLRFVVYMARTYRGYGLPEADLIQEGNVGLMKAVKRFDPNVGVRLVSFAVHWIKAEIHEFILRNWRIVKLGTTKAQRKLFFKLRERKKSLTWLTTKEKEAIAADLDVKVEEVSSMEARLAGPDLSTEMPSDEEEQENGNWLPASAFADDGQNPAEIVEAEDWDNRRREALHDALNALDERSRAILVARWLNERKATLHELAAQYNVSAERIRQIESAAMQKIRNSAVDLAA